MEKNDITEIYKNLSSNLSNINKELKSEELLSFLNMKQANYNYENISEFKKMSDKIRIPAYRNILFSKKEKMKNIEKERMVEIDNLKAKKNQKKQQSSELKNLEDFESEEESNLNDINIEEFEILNFVFCEERKINKRSKKDGVINLYHFIHENDANSKTKGRVYVCKFCNKKFHLFSALGGHISKNHPKQSKDYHYRKMSENNKIVERRRNNFWNAFDD
jgi:hypothetical protein